MSMAAHKQLGCWSLSIVHFLTAKYIQLIYLGRKFIRIYRWWTKFQLKSPTVRTELKKLTMFG